MDGRYRSADLPVDGATTELGRRADLDVVLAGHGVSELHARLSVVDGVLWIRDLDSASGTHVNDAPFRAVALALGDRVRVGEHVFEIREG